MDKKKQLTEFEQRNDDAVMCLKYYGEALCSLALNAVRGATEFPYYGQPFKPEEFAETIGNRPFTQDEYLVFLGSQGFDVDKIKTGVAALHQRIDESHARAKVFFEIFKTEWIIEQSDIEKYLDHSTIHNFIELVVRDSASTVARLKAIKMHAKSPKQADKALVRQYWNDWQQNQPDRYKSKAAFAHDMIDKFPNLESQPVIEGWCRTWERKA